MLFDFAVSDSPELIPALRSLWFPTHAAVRGQENGIHLAESLAEAACDTVLLTDDTSLAKHEFASQFDRVIQLDIDRPQQPAETIGESWLALFFAQTIEAISTMEPGTLLWIHCAGLNGTWDAPYALRQSLADEDDPDPPTDITPPSGNFDPKHDEPDILLGHQQAYSAQLTMLDDFLGVFLDVVRALDTPTMFSLLSTRGYPLGEHGTIGTTNSLNSESLHVPLMVRWPDGRASATRSQSLVQPGSLYQLLIRWLTADDGTVFPFSQSVLANQSQEVALSVCDQHQAIQTHAWKLIRKIGSESIQLYNKPDDRWEVNDVHDRCPRIVPELISLLDDCLSRLNEFEDTPRIVDRLNLTLDERLTT